MLRITCIALLTLASSLSHAQSLSPNHPINSEAAQRATKLLLLKQPARLPSRLTIALNGGNEVIGDLVSEKLHSLRAMGVVGPVGPNSKPQGQLKTQNDLLVEMQRCVESLSEFQKSELDILRLEQSMKIFGVLVFENESALEILGVEDEKQRRAISIRMREKRLRMLSELETELSN
ncbi:MAG: hypothetical protein ACE361_00910 [Aureliella sp.]